jgi:AraC-like DNA-binding protein
MIVLKYISIISVVNLILFAIILFVKKSPVKKSNNLLSIIFLLFAFSITILYLKYIAYINYENNILIYYFPIDKIFLALIGPTVMCYLHTLFDKRPLYSKLQYAFFIISMLPSIIYNIYFISLDENQRLDILLSLKNKLDLPIKIVLYTFFIQITLYLIYFYFFLRKQTKELKNTDSFHNVFELSWMKPVFLIDASLMILCIIGTNFSNSDFSVVVSGLIILNIQYILVFGRSLWQTGIFKENGYIKTLSEQTNITVTDKEIEAPKLLVSKEIADEYLKQLHTTMQQQKLYLKKECNIQLISETSNISVHHISNCLNVHLQKNFNEFLNEYRIEEAKKKLSDPNINFTIEAIGYECGFGSKANFNNVFKKNIGITPSEYRKSKFQMH